MLSDCASRRAITAAASSLGYHAADSVLTYYTRRYDIVGRFNGGANAGHTVVVGDKKFAFHLLPCGLVYPHTQNVLGNGAAACKHSLLLDYWITLSKVQAP